MFFNRKILEKIFNQKIAFEYKNISFLIETFSCFEEKNDRIFLSKITIINGVFKEKNVCLYFEEKMSKFFKRKISEF